MPVPDFSPGEVLTAAAMDQVGLWLVKTQTITAGVSSVTVTNAFSANYENYLVLVDNLVTSAASGFPFQVGASNTAYYWSAQVIFYATSASGVEVGNNATSFASGLVSDSTGAAAAQIHLFSPFSARKTSYTAHGIDSRTNGAGGRAYSGFLNNTTSHTSITFNTTAGTISSGTIRVYGYRN